MQDRLTDRSRRAMALAADEAYPGPTGAEHLMIGILREGEAIAAQVLASFGLTAAGLRAQITATTGPPPATEGSMLTAHYRQALRAAWSEAIRLGNNYLACEHLLLGLTLDSSSPACQALAALGIDLEQVRRRTLRMLGEPEYWLHPTLPRWTPVIVTFQSGLQQAYRLRYEQVQELLGPHRQLKRLVKTKSEVEIRLGTWEELLDAIDALPFELPEDHPFKLVASTIKQAIQHAQAAFEPVPAPVGATTP